MSQLSPAALGISLLLLAFAFLLLVQLFMRGAYRLLPRLQKTSPPPIPIHTNAHSDAVLLIQTGGRVVYANAQAREWFGFCEEDTNLERLARRVRPGEALLALCAREGVATFSLDGRLIDGTSYAFPETSPGSVLVALRQSRPNRVPQKTNPAAEWDGIQSANLLGRYDILAEFSQKLSAGQDLVPMLQTILETVERTIPAEFSQITIWDPARSFLVAYRFYGVQGVDRHLVQVDDRYGPGDGYTGQLIEKRTPLLITDTEAYPKTAGQASPQISLFRSFLGVPILNAGELLGTIELGSIDSDAFHQEDLESLITISSQAAIALNNAFLLRKDNWYATHLAGLAHLAGSIRSTGDSRKVFAELADRIPALLDVETFGCLLYDEREHSLVAQAPFHGLPDEFVGLYRVAIPGDSIAQETWSSREPILTANAPEDNRLRALSLDHTARAAGIRHAVFVPIQDGERKLGFLQAANKQDGTVFTQHEVDFLRVVAEQMASLPELRQLALGELRDAKPLRDLSSEAISGSTEPTKPSKAKEAGQAKDSPQTPDLESRTTRTVLEIVESLHHQSDRREVLFALGRGILNLLKMEIALYAENCAGEPKMIHVPGSLPEGTRLEALFGQKNPLKHCLATGEILPVSNLEESSVWVKSPLLRSLEAKAFIALPVSRNGGTEFAILAISRSALPPLAAGEEQLLALLARQAANALDYLDRLEATRRRLSEVNLLLEFTRQIGNPDRSGILQALIHTTRQAVPGAQACMVARFDPARNALIPECASGYPNEERLSEVSFPCGASLPGQAWAQSSAVRIDETDFTRHYNLSSESLIAYRDAAGGSLPFSSLAVSLIPTRQMGMPDQARGAYGVLILDHFQTPAAFTQEDQDLATSLAQQTALILDNLRLSQAAHERAEQLRALAAASRRITASLHQEELISGLLDQLRSVIPFDTGAIWLLQEDRLAVRAALGFDDNEERVGLSVAIEDSLLFAQMIADNQPIVVSDVRDDPRFQAIDDFRCLSWLGLPLVQKGETLGVIALEKVESDYFSPEDIQLASMFAGQAAVALENAALYSEVQHRAEELDQRTRRLAALNLLSTRLGKSLDIQHILEVIGQELLKTLDCSLVSAILRDNHDSLYPDDSISGSEQPKDILVYETPSTSEQLPLALPDIPLFDRLEQTLGSFFCEEIAKEADLAPLSGFLEKRETQALLVLPLVTGGLLHGLLLVHTSQPSHFSPEEIELARTISNQAAIAIENARLLAETLRLTEDLDRRVRERTYQLEREHHRSETLLRIITELSASLDLEQVLYRTLNVLNDVIRAAQITCLVYRPGEGELRHVVSIGDSGEPLDGRSHSSSEGDQALAGHVLASRQALLIEDLAAERQRLSLPGAYNGYRSAIAVPLVVGEEMLGAMLLFHPSAGHFSQDQLDLAQAAANQVAVAINNTELYTLIRDQAEDLGGLLRNQQVETSRSRAILEAIAEGALVTDANRKITLFNPAAQQILGLDREEILGQSLEHFAGLFGAAASAWMETIAAWSESPQAYQPGESYVEQIMLEDGRVVLVNLAPVLLGDEFLGTVSIFHDITHQVEVDRLKTEFVATVSHELRTPMTSIKGYVEILLMGAAGELSDQQRHFLEVVNQNNERLAVLVNDLLNISRIESGKVVLSFQPLELKHLARDVLEELVARSIEEKKEMVFALELPPDLPRVTADPEQLRQILRSLLNNAYQYTLENGHVRLSARQAGEWLIVEIRDTGIGIPPEEHKRVFERFYRGENPLVLATSGTGLGLNIVQQLVEMHGGSIWLESTGVPGEGSAFSFSIPVYEREEPQS